MASPQGYLAARNALAFQRDVGFENLNATSCQSPQIHRRVSGVFLVTARVLSTCRVFKVRLAHVHKDLAAMLPIFSAFLLLCLHFELEWDSLVGVEAIHHPLLVFHTDIVIVCCTCFIRKLSGV